MLRRLRRLALAPTLSASAFTATASARGFAQPPGAPHPRPIDDEVGYQIERPDPAPSRITAAARAKLRRVLARRRTRNVAAFRGYVRRGVYPHNFVTEGPLNVWRDQEGHLCAAATMIRASGARKLVARVARTDNYVRLADVTEGPLMDWILTSGLTQDEVAAIQEPFFGIDRPAPEPIIDLRLAEDARLRARYAEVLTMLAEDRADSLEEAIDALAARPDLMASLLAS